MRYAFGAAIFILAAVAFCFGWRATDLAGRLREREQTIHELKHRLGAVEKEIVTQRELLRGQTLTQTLRTPDEFLALFPARFPSGNWQPAEAAFEDCWFLSADGLRLHGWLLRHPEPKGAVLYIHGNAGNVTHRAARAQMLSRRCAASIFLFDFRGYGRSEGTPTVAGLLRDARAARALLAEREGVAESQIVLLGESLGGAVAVELAAADGARGLILESTFSSLKEVASAHYPSWLVDTVVADRLHSAKSIRNFHGPLLQVHGDRDRTIHWHSAKHCTPPPTNPKRWSSFRATVTMTRCRRSTNSNWMPSSANFLTEPLLPPTQLMHQLH